MSRSEPTNCLIIRLTQHARNTEVAIRQAMLNQGVQALHNPASISREQWEKLSWRGKTKLSLEAGTGQINPIRISRGANDPNE